MATTNSVQEFLTLLGRRDKAFKEGASKAFKTLVYETADYAKQNLEGTVKTKTLRAMGHPFARAAVGISTKATTRKSDINKRIKKILGKGGKVNLLPINYQTGKLSKSVYLKHYKDKQGEHYDYGFSPTVAYYAKYVLAKQGTKYMKQRGYWAAFTDYWHKKRRRLAFKVVR